jgi:hypothetical protein
VQCDLFVLSWTLTPSLPSTKPQSNIIKLQPTAFVAAQVANRALTPYLAIPQYQGANKKHDQRMN